MKKKALVITLLLAGVGTTLTPTKSSIKIQNIKHIELLSKSTNYSNQTMTSQQAEDLKGKIITINNIKFGGIKAVKIASDMSTNTLFASPNFNPNGFASTVNKNLYYYELNPANDNLAMNEAIKLHGGNPVDTCVFFQSSALRAIGQDVPDYIGFTTHLERWLGNNGWERHTDFQYLQRGDICFASYYHTFLFMGWENKSKGIAYVMGNESYCSPYYRNRNLSGQSPVTYGDNSYYNATCYWTYGSGYTGPIEGADPVHQGGYNAIGTTQSTAVLNIQKSPNTWSNIIGKVPSGITIPVISQNGPWFEIYYNGNTGWIDGNYTSGLDESMGAGANNTNMPQGDNLVVEANGGLYLNTSPSLDSTQIVLLPNGTAVKAIGWENGWYKVDYEGTIGWIDAEYTSANGKDILPVNKTVQTNTSSEKKKTDNTFTQSSVDGTVRVLADDLCLNQKPFVNDGIITTLSKGTVVKAIAKSSNGWYKVEYKGQVGWIGGSPYSDFKATPKTENNTFTQTSVDGTITVLAYDLCLNKKPFANDGIIATLPKGTVVKAIAKSSNGWYKVEYKGQVGWIGGFPYSTFKKAPKIINTVNYKNAEKTATVNANGGLWLNENPSLNNPKNIEVMPNGSSLKILEQKGDWTEVIYDGQVGWAYSLYITIN